MIICDYLLYLRKSCSYHDILEHQELPAYPLNHFTADCTYGLHTQKAGRNIGRIA